MKYQSGAQSQIYHIHVHRAYDYLGPSGVLWVHMAWHKNCVKKKSTQTIYSKGTIWSVMFNNQHYALLVRSEVPDGYFWDFYFSVPLIIILGKLTLACNNYFFHSAGAEVSWRALMPDYENRLWIDWVEWFLFDMGKPSVWKSDNICWYFLWSEDKYTL